MISKENNLGAEDTKTIKWIKGNILLLVHGLQQWIVFKGRWKSEESIMLAGVRVFYNFFSVIAHSAWFIYSRETDVKPTMFTLIVFQSIIHCQYFRITVVIIKITISLIVIGIYRTVQ